MGLSFPIRLGGEVAGTVAALGERSKGFDDGDAVFGINVTGGFAEYAVVDATSLTRKPVNLDFVHSPAVPLGALTPWQAMCDLGGLTNGQRRSLTNGSGGVGSLAIQIAKATGAHVTAMTSGRNESYMKIPGADDFIDYTRQPFEHVASEMDVVFDTVGGDTFHRAFGTLRSGGVLLTAVEFPKDEGKKYGVRPARVFCKPDAGQLAQILGLLEAGQLQPHVTTVLPLAEIWKAFELSETGRTRGKIVLQMEA